jgi:hypothetical protein
MAEREDVYVGYRAMPAGVRRAVTVIVPVLIIAMLGVMVISAIAMRDPGPAVWNTSAERTWRGRLIMHPYPMLAQQTDGGVRIHLIVGIGKVGVHDRLFGMDGMTLELAGFPLERDDRRMIEIADREEAVKLIGDGSFAPTVLQPVGLGEGAYAGEVVDGKCFLGAMKPGDGPAHKACAVLCIEGGLPPMVRTIGSDGQPLYMLLTVEGSTRLPEPVLNMVGEPVVVEGRMVRLGDLLVIDCDADCVSRYRAWKTSR